MQRSELLRHGPLDQGDPIDWNHPQAQGLWHQWISLPGSAINGSWRDLCDVAPRAAWNNLTPGATAGHHACSRPGGAGDVRLPGGITWLETTIAGDLNSYSVFAWILLTGTAGTRTIINFDGSGTQRMSCGIENTTNKLYQFVNGNSEYLTSSAGVVSATIWTHVGYVRNRGDAKVYFYINGRRDATTVSTSVNPTAHTRIRIGTREGAVGSEPFIGRLDDLRLYNRPLSAAEALAVFQGSVNSLPPHLRRAQRVFAAVGGTAFTQSLGGTLASTGATPRAATRILTGSV